MYTRRYALLGALAGLTFPLTATPVEALWSYGNLPFGRALALAQTSPLLWMIDCTPLFIALLAGLLGWRQDELVTLEAARRAHFDATSRELFASAQALLSAVSSLSSTSAETAASVRETTAAMSSLGETANKAALTAESVIGFAHASRKASEEGLAAVETSTGELSKLSEEVRALSKRVVELDARMRDIFEVTSVVGYLADRSQKLADAAAVQVQRAAGADAGLTAVVTEMRSHAEDARRAARQVRTLVDATQKAMAAATSAADAGVRRAEEGARVASGTGESIRRLAEALRESSEAAREIADVARQQDHGIDQVLGALKEIDLATQESMDASHAVASQARSLNDLASALRGPAAPPAAPSGARAA
ncbi:MAG: methyl-accepting chemotaxis protein [Anaeromyxobacteraceae bacterium]